MDMFGSVLIVIEKGNEGQATSVTNHSLIKVEAALKNRIK